MGDNYEIGTDSKFKIKNFSLEAPNLHMKQNCRTISSPYSKVHAETLMVFQIVKKFPAFHRTRMFIYRCQKNISILYNLAQAKQVHIIISKLR
jgi:hypothetical protein